MQSRRVIALAVVAGAFGSLDTALNVAFPDLVDDLGLELADLSWVVVCYVLTYGALLLAAGQLGDAIGYRRAASFGSLVSIAALVGCAVAPSFGVLLAARVAQGVGIATVMASAPALLTADASSPGGTRRGVGVFETATAAGLAIGPIVGGPLVELAGWRAVFWFRVPLGIALFVLAVRAASGMPSVSATSHTEVDRRGMMLASAGLGALVMALNLGGSYGWTSPLVLGSFVATAAAGYGFVISSRHSPAPLLQLDLFRSRPFLIANILSIVAHGAMFATWLFVPTFLVDQLGVSVIVAGFVLATSPLLTALVSRYLVSHRKAGDTWKLTTIGLGIEAIAMFGLSAGRETWSPWTIAALLGLVGLGLGLFTVPNMSLVMSALPASKQGVGGGLSLMTRTIGIVTGVAAASAVFDHYEPQRGFIGAFAVVFIASAIALALAAAASLVQLARSLP